MASRALRLRDVQQDGTARVSYLGRLLDVLELVGAGDEHPPGMADITRRTGIPLSTVSRLLALLSERRLVRRMPGGGYAPGPSLLRTALRGFDDLGETEALAAAVHSLAAVSGESVSAGLLVDDEIVLVARCNPARPPRAPGRLGDVVPPHINAMGKAILAHVDPPRRVELIKASVGSKADFVLRWLAGELQQAREAGFARDEQPDASGFRSCAVPVFGSGGRAVGAISVAGPAGRFTLAEASAVVPRLLGEGAALSAERRSQTGRTAF